MATLLGTPIYARDAAIATLSFSGLKVSQAALLGYRHHRDDGFWHDTTRTGGHWSSECTTCRILALAPMEGPPEKDGTYPDGLPFP